MLLFRQRFTGCLDVPDSPVLGSVAATEYIGGWPWHYNANSNRAGVWALVTPQKPLYALPRDDRQPLLRGHSEDRPRDNPHHRGRKGRGNPGPRQRAPPHRRLPGQANPRAPGHPDAVPVRPRRRLRHDGAAVRRARLPRRGPVHPWHVRLRRPHRLRPRGRRRPVGRRLDRRPALVQRRPRHLRRKLPRFHPARPRLHQAAPAKSDGARHLGRRAPRLHLSRRRVLPRPPRLGVHHREPGATARVPPRPATDKEGSPPGARPPPADLRRHRRRRPPGRLLPGLAHPRPARRSVLDADRLPADSCPISASR